MTKAQWIEVSAIAVFTAISWLVWPQFSAMPLWQIVLGLSALVLAQSLVRDIAILLRSRRSASQEPRKEAQCFCLESTVGSTGVLAGAVLAGFGGSTPVAIDRWELSLAAAATMVAGFLVKDLVISWRPFGVRRETDHLNLVVRWKSK